jgi:hypothetical protein
VIAHDKTGGLFLDSPGRRDQMTFTAALDRDTFGLMFGLGLFFVTHH